MKKVKKILGRFWVQVGALCSVAVLAVALRLLFLPTKGRWQISPFFSLVDLHVSGYTFIPPLAFAAFMLSLSWALRRRDATKWAFFALAFFAFTTTVNMAAGGPTNILPDFVWQYASDAQKLYEYGNFLRDYHARAAGLHWHTTVHPPGVSVYLYPLLKLFGDRWMYVALVNALIAGAGGAFVYKAAERIYGGGAKDAAAALYVTTPSLILYGSTVDAVLCALGAVIIYLLALYFARGRAVCAALTGLAIATGVFLAYQFAFMWVLVLAWSSLYVVFRRKKETRRDDGAPSIGRPAALAAVTAAAFALFFLTIYLVSGFDVVAEFRYQQLASESYYSAGGNVVYWFKRYILGAPAYTGEHRSYLQWVPGNVVAFFFLLGPPTTILFLRHLWDELGGKKAGRLRTAFTPAAALSLVLVNLSGLTLAETERVWLFMVPWFVVGAGYYLEKRGRRFLCAVLGFNLAVSLLFVTFFTHVK